MLVAAGGGVRNPVLMGRIAQLLPGVDVLTTDRLGVPADVKEAFAFALIGWATRTACRATCPAAPAPAARGCSAASPPPPTAACRRASRLAAWPTALSIAGPDGPVTR